MVLRRLFDKTGKPAEENPDYGTADDASKVGCLVYTVCIRGFVEKYTGHNLQ